MEMINNLFGWIPLYDTGGVVMLPIFLCLVFSVAILMERMLALRSGLVIPRDFLVDIEAMAKKKEVEAAAILCKKNGSPLAAVLLGGLKFINLPRSDLLAVLESYGRAQSVRLGRFLDLMALIGTISPLLGLLGTVLGMIKVFGMISQVGVGDPNFLSGGISEALVTTAAGLTVAIPTVIAHRYLSARAGRLVLDLEAVTLEIISLFRGDSHEI